MAESVSFKWTGPGLAELKALNKDLQTKGKNQAARAGAVVYKKALEQALPTSTAIEDNDDVHLADSIAIRKMTKRASGGLARFNVGVIGAAKNYAHVYEFGSYKMRGRRTFTKTLRSEGQAITDAMADKLTKVIKRYG